MRSYTVSIKMVETALKGLKEQGGDLSSLLRANGIPETLRGRDNARISAENYSSFLQSAMRSLGDEMLGYTPVPHRLGTWKMMCHALITAETLGGAVYRYCRFFNLFDWGLSPSLSTANGEAILTLARTDSDRPVDAYAHVSTLFYFHRLISWLVNLEVPILGVDLDCPAPGYQDELRPMFLYSPVRFEQAQSRIRFAERLLELPLQQDRQSLRGFLEQPNLVMITRQYVQDTWQSRVRHLLENRLEDMPTFAEIAGKLKVNAQTLRRHLQREGLSYREIKNQLRRDAAIYWLTKSPLSVEEVAGKTGFAEPSNFIRAFKQWTGVTPYTYRKKL